MTGGNSGEMILKVALYLLIISLLEKDAISQCTSGLPQNLAVYEGTQNVSMMCNSLVKVSWTIRPASDEISTYALTNYDDVVAAPYTNLFGVNSASLLIKKAQGLATIPPISTAGLYRIKISGVNTYGAQLTVIRQPPSCNCTSINSTKINITCSLTYSNIGISSISAKMTWTKNGNFFTNNTPAGSGKLSTAGYWTSTSIIIADAYDPSSYQCMVTFTKPVAGSAIIATNAPTFSASCTPRSCYSPATISPTSTMEPITTTTSGCNCSKTTACNSPEQNCTDANECRSDGTNLTNIDAECVVKAELYARSDNCCSDDLICGVVVTLRNDNRYLIHDPLCNDNKCEMAVVNATCMSGGWKLLAERKITVSGVGDYIRAGSNASMDPSVTDCSESCKLMMNLP